MKLLKKKSDYGEAVKILFIFDNLSKILNFAKNIIITTALGFSRIPDAFNLSRSINGTFFNTLSGALLAGTLPNLNERDDIQDKINYLYSIVIVILSIFAVLGLIIVFNFSPIINFLAPGFEEDQKKYVFIFFLLQLPLSLITVFTNAFESFFRSEKIFGISNLIKFFISIIAFLLIFFLIKSNYYILAIGPLIGTVAGFIFFIFLIPKKMTRFDKSVFVMVKSSLPLVLGGSFTIINSFVDKGFSSTLPEGQLTNLDLANRLFEQIKGLIAGPIVGALYAFLSHSISNREYKPAQDKLFKVTDSLFTLFTIIFIGFSILGRWLLSLIFQHGLVGADSILMLYYITLILFPMCYSLQNVLALILFSFKNTMFCAITGIIATLFNIILNYIFVKIFGIYALATSTMIVVLINAIICSVYVEKKYSLRTYKSKHVIILLTSILSSFSIIFYNNIMIKLVVAFVLLLELLIFKMITVGKIIKFLKKVKG